MRGTGKEDDPYLVSTPADFDDLRDIESYHRYFLQTNDIDMSWTKHGGYAWTHYDSGHGFEPIRWFKGYYNGNGHKITNLHINAPEMDDIGMFTEVASPAEFLNIHIENGYIVGKNFVGGITDYISGIIADCSFSGTVKGQYMVGGISGGCLRTIMDSSSHGTITGTSNVGGIAGYMTTTGTLNRCYSSTRVIGVQEVGRIVGNLSGTLSHCRSTGTVSGKYRVGLIYGHRSLSSAVHDCGIDYVWGTE